MSNVEIIKEMLVVIGELQGEIYSMRLNPTYAGLSGEIALIEVCSEVVYRRLMSAHGAKYYQVIPIDKFIGVMESIITDKQNEELYLLYTHISQLNTKIRLLR